MSIESHWNSRYKETEQEKLGWYESEAQPSLDLIRSCKVSHDDLIVDIGSGSSVLIDNLINDGYKRIVATDISKVGLDITKRRLGEKAEHVQFIVDDLINPTYLKELSDIDIWHDRAVLHFFTKEPEKQAYGSLLKASLKPNGFAIISTFAVGGLTKCSGLDIQQYTPETLGQLLGPEFKLIKSLKYTYMTTWKQARPFIYCIFQKVL